MPIAITVNLGKDVPESSEAEQSQQPGGGSPPSGQSSTESSSGGAESPSQGGDREHGKGQVVEEDGDEGDGKNDQDF